MTIPNEVLTILVTLFLTIIVWVFQAGQLKQQFYREIDGLQSKIGLLTAKDDGNAEIDGLRFQNLQEKVENMALIVETRHASLTNEIHVRLEQMDARVDDLEAFLMKSTDFVRRKNTR